MSLYIDTSALLKRYVAEHDSDRADELVRSDATPATGRHTIVEVRRNLARLLSSDALAEARADFSTDMDSFAIIELDSATCDLAATIAEQMGVRTLDALHLGAAQRIGGQAIPFLTFDLRQAQAARSLGFTVLGA